MANKDLPGDDSGSPAVAAGAGVVAITPAASTIMTNAEMVG